MTEQDSMSDLPALIAAWAGTALTSLPPQVTQEAGTGAGWHYKLIGRYGDVAEREVLKAEIAGFFLAVDDARSSLRSKTRSEEERRPTPD